VNETDEDLARLGTLLEIYVPRYGDQWEAFMEASVYVRIDAERMFAFRSPDG
jgi:hypothetical protein